MRRSAAAAVLLAALLAGCGRDTPVLPPGAERVSGEEARIAADMIGAIREISEQRYPQGRVLRFNQAKGHGCLAGEFRVLEGLEPALAQGLFAGPAAYPAVLRFASATQFDDREKDFRGLSIKLTGVPGEPLLGDPGEQDFLFNSHPALFAGTPGDFLAFIEATRDGRVWRYFLNPAHWYSLGPILRGRDRIDDPLAIRYFSTTPFRHGGESTAVKHAVRPCPGTVEPVSVETHEDFLADAMAARLAAGPVCLEFMVQPQTDPASMPVENAAEIWDEARSPFRPVARITVERQDFRARDGLCERMSFNPWQTLPEHRPLGGINRVRRAVYAEAAEFRRDENRRRGQL